MAKPSAKIPRIVNADKAGLSLDPGTLIFNNDTDVLEYVNLAAVFIPISGTETLQDAYNAGNGTITIETVDNTKPFAVGNDETTLFPGYGVRVSAVRNIQATPTQFWFQFFEAFDTGATMTQYGALACQVLDGTPGAVVGQMDMGAAVAADGEVVPFLSANGLSTTCDMFFDGRLLNGTNTVGNIRDLNFTAENSLSNLINYSVVHSEIRVNTSGTESGLLSLRTYSAGSLVDFIRLFGDLNTIEITKPIIFDSFLNINGQNIVNVGNITTAASPDASAQLQLTSTTKGALVNTLTTAQFAAIASPATGLLAYDTNKLRYTSWNGAAVKDIAYTSDVPTTGTSIGGVSVFSQINCTGATVVNSFVSRVGNVANGSAKVTFNATTGVPTVILTMPFTTGFLAPDQGSGNGTIARTPPANAIGDGIVTIVATVALQGMQFSCIVATSPASYDMYITFSYLIN